MWLGSARSLCSGCFADPRLRARWIDERQKQSPVKPMWAKDEPEEFAHDGAATRVPAPKVVGKRQSSARAASSKAAKSKARARRKGRSR